MRTRALAAAALLLSAPALGAEPAFEEGDVLGFADVAKLEPFLPREFWAHRELFFHEGMQLEIGPAHRDYSPAAPYVAATKEFAGKPKIGPEGGLLHYTAGQPFPMEKVDCANDPDAGTKIAWNFDYQWEGSRTEGTFRLFYLDRGEELPLSFEGTFGGRTIRPRGSEDRKSIWGFDVTEPEALRGTAMISYRYAGSDRTRAEAERDDAMIYLPAERRTVVLAERALWAAIAGTDLTLEDRTGFVGRVIDFTWTCRGERELIAPMNTKRTGFPYERRTDFGPSGASYASDRWELRRAVLIRAVRKDPRPYAYRDLWLDAQTLVPLYGFVYDAQGVAWKVVWHNHRWSGDDLPADREPWYRGWEGYEEPRDLRVISDVIANVQTGSVTRVEFWDAHGTRRRFHHDRLPPRRLFDRE